MKPLINHNILELIEAYRKQTLSPVNVIASTYSHYRKLNPIINAIYTVDEISAVRAASKSERRWIEGRPLSQLDGIPFTVKDSVRVKGLPYHHGIKSNPSSEISTWTSPPVLRLLEAGAILLGKTTMPDGGLLGSGVSSLYGVTKNPFHLEMNPGGSSSGAAVSVASGIGFFALGTDIAGSVRIPAAHCCISALKPTQGRIPHLTSDTMRAVGPMARSVLDIAVVMDVITAPHERDVWSFPSDGRAPYVEAMKTRSLAGLKIGYLQQFNGLPKPSPRVIKHCEELIEKIRSKDALVVNVETEISEDSFLLIDRWMRIKGWAELQEIVTNLPDALNPALTEWAAEADRFKATDVFRLMGLLGHVRERAYDLMNQYDYLLTPTIGYEHMSADSLWPYDNNYVGGIQYTALFNQTGQPAAAVPVGCGVDGLPISIQLVGHRFDDRGVISVAALLEALAGVQKEWPYPL